MAKNIIIVGGCVAAKEAALAARKTDPNCNITIISEEKYYPYYRPMLSECIIKNVNEKHFYLASKEDYVKNNIKIKLGEKAISFIPKQKLIKTNKGNIYNYDKLLIATGSKNFIPIPEAMKIPGVFSIRKYSDSINVKHWINTITYKKSISNSHAVIIGGGLLGLETAWELISCGINVTIIELSPILLPNQIDKEASSFLSKIISSNNINLILGKTIEKINGTNKIDSIILNDNTTIPCDVLIFSVGIRANIDLVKNSGIKINRGIIVNTKMETSIKDVFAAGDVAELKECPSGIWRPALEQGKIAGTNMAGDNITYKKQPIPTFLKVFNTQIYSIGNIKNCDKENCIKFIDEQKGIYKKLFFKENILVGGILIGDIKNSTKILKGIQNKITKRDYNIFIF
ncbi:NAD(P)/FAD-dependent oxidoreductase [Defluviitalea phaphyphila]|uniref:NAD(P)/FAD-dependent oxidoreductase n=1 Tax=Defluviitalea phaphyphila TaxID=1473580 RepID=UPI000731A0F0|nr:FAD-dependent oxidoreductase [Defluviitalea phaphyphila]